MGNRYSFTIIVLAVLLLPLSAGAYDFKVGNLCYNINDDSTSVSFPRVNGRWLLFTAADFGTFPIWHKEADLMLLDLADGTVRRVDELNSDDTESYHSWSSGGHWVVFSSRRIDGRYTRLFLSHFDGEGNFSKPFLLPQEDPGFNQLRLKSYNIPEFVKGPVPDRQDAIAGLFPKKEDAQ